MIERKCSVAESVASTQSGGPRRSVLAVVFSRRFGANDAIHLLMKRIRRFGGGSNPWRIRRVAPQHRDSFWSMQGTVETFGAKELMPNAALIMLVTSLPMGAMWRVARAKRTYAERVGGRM